MQQTESLCRVTIRMRVPATAGKVYLTGNLPELGPWEPGKFPMEGTGTERTATLRVPKGTALEFKVTQGSWDKEGLGPSGTVLPNFQLTVMGDVEADFAVVDFKKGIDDFIDHWKESRVIGRLDYWKSVPSAFLPGSRHVEIWLPPAYDANPQARFPVMYMHDGQNLFDPRIANTGMDWGVDESIARLVQAGKMEPIIVVGVWCTDIRLREYSPWDLGPQYSRFLIEELMPRVNSQYRTLTGPANTGVMGSSMGGLMSFYLCREHPEVFGRGGCLSTHWPWNGTILPATPLKPALIDAELSPDRKFPPGVRLYFDYGSLGIDASYAPYQEKVTAWLAAQGYREGANMQVKSFPGADHNEAAWRARLDGPMEFLWGKSAPAAKR